MATYRVAVKYYYKKPGAGGNGAATSWSGPVSGNSESIVLDYLRKKHKGYEIVIRELVWK